MSHQSLAKQSLKRGVKTLRLRKFKYMQLKNLQSYIGLFFLAIQSGFVYKSIPTLCKIFIFRTHIKPETCTAFSLIWRKWTYVLNFSFLSLNIRTSCVIKFQAKYSACHMHSWKEYEPFLLDFLLTQISMFLCLTKLIISKNENHDWHGK